MGRPIVKIMFYVVLYASRSTEGRQKWLGVRVCVENESEVVSRIDSDCAVCNLVDAM